MVICGAWHSPVVRTVRVREVSGSNPLAPTPKTLLEIEVFLFGAQKGCYEKVSGFPRWRSGQANPLALERSGTPEQGEGADT